MKTCLRQLICAFPFLAILPAYAQSTADNDNLRNQVLSVARTLSTPEAARILPAFSSLDRTSGYRDKYLSPLDKPYSKGEAGFQEITDRVLTAREQLDDSAFHARPLILTDVQAKPSNIQLELDFAPAEAILELIESGEQNQATIMARLQREDVRAVFESLIEHRSQSFYGTPISWELLAQNIAMANSNAPLQRLYGYAQPYAFLDFAEVRLHARDYRRVLGELERQHKQLLDQVLAGFQEYTPANAHFKRKVSILFCAGSDGWASGNVAGIDLEYFKDDYAHLIGLMTHESYHAAQHATARYPEENGLEEPAAVWSHALGVLYREGSATFVSPPKVLTEAQQQEMAQKAVELFDQLEKAVFIDKNVEQAEKLVGNGTSGAGPFYWLGRAMSQAIVNESGKEGLALVMPEGSPAFLRAYAKAVSDEKAKGLIPQELMQRMLATQ